MKKEQVPVVLLDHTKSSNLDLNAALEFREFAQRQFDNCVNDPRYVDVASAKLSVAEALVHLAIAEAKLQEERDWKTPLFNDIVLHLGSGRVVRV